MNNADEAAMDFAKQLITLSSGVLALSATFLKNLQTDPFWLPWILGLTWLLFIASLFCAIQTMSIIIKSRIDDDVKWDVESKPYASTSKVTFFIGMLVFAVFALLHNLYSDGIEQTITLENHMQIIREMEGETIERLDNVSSFIKAQEDVNSSISDFAEQQRVVNAQVEIRLESLSEQTQQPIEEIEKSQKSEK